MTQAKRSANFAGLPKELQIAVSERTSLVTPARRVFWGAEGYYLDLLPVMHKDRPCCGQRHGVDQKGIRLCNCWVPPTSLFLVNRDFYHMSMEVFAKWNTFGVKEMKSPLDINTAILLSQQPISPIPFLQQMMPTPAFHRMTSLYLEVHMSNQNWRAFAESVALLLTRLRSLTMVGKYYFSDTMYDFGDTHTIDLLRVVAETNLWPMIYTLGSPIERFIVHLNRGVGGWAFTRFPNWEPTYFFEASDITPANATIRHSIKSTDDGVYRDVTVGGKVWIEGVVRISVKSSFGHHATNANFSITGQILTFGVLDSSLPR
ncbi:hypothetical protein PG996_015924 [Apiospora saccharicola]|uniref:Uncharacterized protein n=1 Tax=Apiospora saccharicola TaxID=335842 RepID=A0ABR1TMG7_9PEZI